MITRCEYSITVSASACHAEDVGSIPTTRSIYCGVEQR